MSEMLDTGGAVRWLLKTDNVLILCHKNPDGDTLGAAAALYWGMRSLKKTAAVFCADTIGEQYDYMEIERFYNQFTPQYAVAVDIAGVQMFGESGAVWAERVNLCIDHHASNSGYADTMLLDAAAGSTCEIMYELLLGMKIDMDTRIANCLYTGVSTDTGCFKFANTTARTHHVAERLIALGADLVVLNELLFENRSKQRIAIEQMAFSTLEYHYDSRCALICLTREMMEKVGADAADLEGITALPRSIEGVLVGITMRQQPSGSYTISARTKAGIDATHIVRGLGGGGHKQAAGCEVVGGLDFIKKAILAEVGKVMPNREPLSPPLPAGSGNEGGAAG